MTINLKMTADEADAMHARGEYLVPEYNLGALRERLEKLNRRATKLGCKPTELTELEQVDEPMKDKRTGKPNGQVRRWVLVRITGEAPRLAGWTFVAILDIIETGTLSRAVPGQAIPVAYRNAEPHCDHCQTQRNRRSHYLLRNEACEHKMVGRSCLRDFLGHVNPEALARGAELLSSAAEMGMAAEDEGLGGGGQRSYGIGTVDYLTWVIIAIERDGWLSRGQARDWGKVATADTTLSYLTPAYWREIGETQPVPTETQVAEAQAVHAWVQDLDARAQRAGKELSDYEHNLYVAGSGEVTRWDHVGIVASAVAAYRREQEREVKRREFAKGRPKSTGYLGKPGERIDDLEVTVTWSNRKEGNWGMTVIIKMLDAQGRALVWFATNPPIEMEEQGRSFRIKATVKEHKEYNGEPETVITRCKMLEAHKVEAAK